MKGLKDWAKETYPVKQQVDVRSLPVSKVSYDNIRGLDPDVCKLYGIQLHLDDNDKPVRYAFKHTDNVKYRGYDEKVFWTKEKGKPFEDLFGPEFNAGTSKKIFITEGEFDAASLYQILGKTYPVVSLPSASIGEKFVKKNYKYLSTFQEVIYAGELDDAGKRAAEVLYGAFPQKFWYVPMSQHKDANEFLMAGAGDALKWAAIKPQRYTPDNFFCSSLDVERAILTENPYEYVPTGHTGIDEKCRGLIKGGITFIKAPRGTGKTEVIRYFETAMLRDPDERIALLHMEEMKSTTYRAMATYELGVNVRTKDDAKSNAVDEKEVIEAAIKATKGERTIIFEMRLHDDPMKLLEYVRLAASVYGAGFIFIDHVQRLAYLSSAGVDGATSLLTALGSQMAQLAKELNIGVIFISQVNEDGRTKYAAALEEEAIICLEISREVDSEDEVEQNTTYFKVSKNRPFARLGTAGSLFYDPETTLLREGF
jgi:twinkle protein